MSLEKAVAPGVTTEELDRIAETEIRRRGAKPAFVGYRGYPKTLCTSINDEVVHGIPGDRALRDGDVVGIDCGAVVERLLRGCRRGRSAGGPHRRRRHRSCSRSPARASRPGIAAARPGNRVSDIGAAVEAVAIPHGYGVVRDFVGHGVGTALHEEPQIPNYGPGRARQPPEGGHGDRDRADVQPGPGGGGRRTRTAGPCGRGTAARRRISSITVALEPQGAVILGLGRLARAGA